MNNRLFYFLFAITTLTLTNGCASPKITFKPTPTDNQTIVYSDGSEAIYSDKENLVILSPIGMVQALDDRHHFFIKVMNKSDQNILVGSKHATATLHTQGFGKNIGVWTYEELVEEAERKRNTAMVLTALAGAASAYSAAQSAYSYDSGSFSGYDNYGGYYTGSYSGYTYNPGAASTAMTLSSMQTAQNVALIENGLAAELASYGEVLKLTTLFPGYEYGGVLVFDRLSKKDYGKSFTITFDLGHEKHNFSFDLLDPRPKKQKEETAISSKPQEDEPIQIQPSESVKDSTEPSEDASNKPQKSAKASWKFKSTKENTNEGLKRFTNNQS